MKKRKNDPWMPASDYGHSLPKFTINLLVKDVQLACRFYVDVLEAEVHYKDEDFAALLVLGLEFMLHADHTYESRPWAKTLARTLMRGLGVELRLLGIDPDEVEKIARQRNDIIVAPVSDKPHGWREPVVQDPDGYVWAVGEKIKQSSIFTVLPLLKTMSFSDRGLGLKLYVGY